ncbi:uncharacterized protein LOC110464815 isoform X2 [Mizuhopecten yessoensis]|nr:uncharacterized protein LOC110464815 isoform X2 [Mizuhopecten yessoensis]
MDYFSTLYVLFIMTLGYSNEIAAQRKHAFLSQNSQRLHNNGFDRNSRTSTSEGFASNRKSMMISDPSNAFNFRQNARRGLGQNIKKNYRGRQTGGTFRNRPLGPISPSTKKHSPSFSMPVLPKPRVRQGPITTTPGYMMTTEEQYVVGSAVVSKPAKLSGWASRSNGRSTGQWHGNTNGSPSKTNNVKNGPGHRTDEYIYMVNGHPARPQENTWSNEGIQKQPQSGNMNNNAGRKTLQPDTNSVNKRQSLTNNFHQNGHYKNLGQFQGTQNQRNTVQPAFQRYSSDPVKLQTKGMFQYRKNNRKSGGMANNNNLDSSNRHASLSMQVDQRRIEAVGLSNTDEHWRKGSKSSPDIMMTLTPNENNIGMNRIQTTTSDGNTHSLPSTMSIRISQNGRVLPSVMPQLSPTRGSEHLIQNSHHKTDTGTINMVSFPQSRRQYISNPVGVNKLPIPSPRPVGTSAIPADSLHINTRIVQHSYPSPTSMTMGQSTPGFNRSPVPPYYINNQGNDPSTITGSARSAKPDTRFSLYNGPNAPPRHHMGMLVPPVIGMDTRSTPGQNRGPNPTPEIHMRQRSTPGYYNGLKPNPVQHIKTIPATTQHKIPRATLGQRTRARPTPSQYIRHKPTPGRYTKPTPSQHKKTRPTPEQHKRSRPTTPGRYTRPRPTPGQRKRPTPTQGQYIRPSAGQHMRPTPTQGQYIRPTAGQYLKPKPTRGQHIPQGPIHEQIMRPIKPPKHAMVGMSPQFLRPSKSQVGPIRSTMSPRGLLATPIQPSLPLKHQIDMSALPEKQQYNRIVRPSIAPLGPLVGTMHSPMPMKGKMNWQMRQSMSPIGQQIKPIPPSVSPRRHSLGPMQLSTPPKGLHNGIKMRPTARGVGVNIAPSQRPLLHDWPQPSATSLLAPSVRPRSNSNVVDVVRGQPQSLRNTRVYTEQITPIKSNTSDIVKTSGIENTADMSSDYISMTWLNHQKAGMSHNLNQTGIELVPTPKTLSDDDNGHQKISSHTIETYNGENAGKAMKKPVNFNKKDAINPLSKDAVIASQFQSGLRDNVKDREVNFTTESRLKRVNAQQTTATPFKRVTYLNNGTVSNMDLFLIPTPNSFDTEPITVENKTKLATDKKVNSSPKGYITEDTKTVVPIIKSVKQPMRIFDINAFSIIRSHFLPKVPVQTTTKITTTTISTVRSSSVPSSKLTPQQSSPISASRQNSIVSATTHSPTSTAYNSGVDAKLRGTTKATTTPTMAATTSKSVFIRNKNVIPPALQKMMDALRRPGFEAGIPINLNQIIASDTAAAGTFKNVDRYEEAGGIKVGTTLGMRPGTPTTGYQGSYRKTNIEITAETSTTIPTSPSPPTTVTIPSTMTTIDYSTSVIPMETSTLSAPVSSYPLNQGTIQDLYHTPSVVQTTTDSDMYSTTPSVPQRTTESKPAPITGIPFFVDHIFWKDSNIKLPVGSLKTSMEPTTETPKRSTTGDNSKPSVFFGLWSPEVHNNSSTEQTQKVSTTSSSTSGSDITNNGISYLVVTNTSPNAPVVSINNLVTAEAASPTVTSTQSRSSIKVKDVEGVADVGYEIAPVTNLMSNNLKKNITNLRRQLEDLSVPSSVRLFTESSKTIKDSTDKASYQTQSEATVILRSKADNGDQNHVQTGISVGVAVKTPSLYPKESKSVQRSALSTNTRLQNVFGARHSLFQGIVIDSSYTVTSPKASSAPIPLPFDKKRTYGESKNINTNSGFEKQTHISQSNSNAQKKTQISRSNFIAKKQPQDSQSTSNVQNAVQISQSNFYIPQQVKRSRSKIPKSDKSRTLFEIPNFFTHMNPFSNDDAGVKHRFLKPKTLQGADKPFETAVNAPVFTPEASKTKDIKPSDHVSQTTVSEKKYDQITGNKSSKMESGVKYRAKNVSTADAKSDSVKEGVTETETDINKQNTAQFNTAPQGILIDASFMKNLPFFLGPVDSKLFKGMQRKESPNLRPPNGRIAQRTKSVPTTSSSTVTTKSVRDKSQAKPPRNKMEYDLKVLCMQFRRSNSNDQTYIPHPADCSKIIQCSPNGNGFQAVARHCPMGLFWDSNTQRCSDPNDVTCFDDPCQKGNFNYSSHGGCGTYYKCFAGVSVPTCCPAGLRFVQTTTDSGECVWDTTCSEPCETLQSSSLRKTGGCPTLRVESRRDAYWMLQRGSLILKTCPDGYLYSHPDCRCKSTARPTTKPTPRCKPEFKLTFDGGIIKDVSDGGLAFSQVNVAGTDNNTAVFRENGYISLWGFQNRYLGRTFSMRMRVRADKGSCKAGGRSIISNCGPDGPTSVEIACAKDKISFKANTDKTRVPPVIWADIKDNEWADIIYTYKGSRFSGSVNGRKSSQSVIGNLESRNNPLIIGKCPKSPGFVGEIDQLEIYTHCVP